MHINSHDPPSDSDFCSPPASFLLVLLHGNKNSPFFGTTKNAMIVSVTSVISLASAHFSPFRIDNIRPPTLLGRSRGSFTQIGESFLALEAGVFDHTWLRKDEISLYTSPSLDCILISKATRVAAMWLLDRGRWRGISCEKGWQRRECGWRESFGRNKDEKGKAKSKGKGKYDVPASASLLKLPVHCTNVLFSLLPLVTA